MTPEQIIENNILLAEFMGWARGAGEFTAPEEFRVNIPFKTTKKQEYFSTTIFKHPELKFNTDWNWLNSLLKRIGDRTEFELVSGYDYSYWNRYGENPILDNEGNPQEFGGYSDIINIYEACTAFVKWYNQNKGGN